jgi:phosphoserine phosphatase
MAAKSASARDYLVITVSGHDRPGITAAFSKILHASRVRIIDVEQATLQDVLALSFLIEPAAGGGSRPDVLKELLYEAKGMGLDLNFRVFPAEEMVTRQARHLYSLTCIAAKPMTEVLARIAALLAERNVNILTIRCLAERAFSCLEMDVDASHAKSRAHFREEILAASAALGVDIGLQRESVFRRNKRLIVFDMDSTLISQEIVDELAKRRGVEREVARLTERAMAGEMDFRESLRQRAAFLRGLTRAQLAAVAKEISLNEGVERLLRAVKLLGYKVALVSSGFDFFTSYMKDKVGLDYAYGNRIELKNGRVTGRVVGEIVDAVAKARILNEIAAREGILPEQVVAIGDGANDVLMLSQAGLGIAYQAKPILKERADASISSSGMLSVLYLLGITERDLAEIEGAARHPARALRESS